MGLVKKKLKSSQTLESFLSRKSISIYEMKMIISRHLGDFKIISASNSVGRLNHMQQVMVIYNGYIIEVEAYLDKENYYMTSPNLALFATAMGHHNSWAISKVDTNDFSITAQHFPARR